MSITMRYSRDENEFFEIFSKTSDKYSMAFSVIVNVYGCLKHM